MRSQISPKKQGPVSKRRTALPERLPKATNFKSDRHFAHPKWFIETLKAQPQFWQPLQEATQLGSRFGRRRLPGEWALAYLAFVVSHEIDVEPWWKTAGHSIWTTAGFRERPSLRVAQRRFAELEEVEDAFLAVAQAMIAHASKASGGRVGHDLHVDSTESETHARLQHVCPKDSQCHQTRAQFVSASLTTEEAREHRHQEAEEPEEEMVSLTAGQVDDVVFDSPPSPEADQVLGRKVRKVKVGGCWYECLDPDAGIRAYVRHGKVKKFWVGYYNAKAIDHYTGAPVAVLVHSASINESIAYPELLDRAIDATGKNPRAVVADRGYSISSVFEHNTRLGVATVANWRAKNSKNPDRAAEDSDRFDRHGIVRCKYCGGPTSQLRFQSKGSPRQWVKCDEPAPGTDCEKVQTIQCKEEWRLLVPLWRNTEAYLALENSARAYERVHHLWRRRYRVASDDHQLRPKRRGRANQQLRSTVALMAEWMHILHREGWLGSARRLLRESYKSGAKYALERLTDFRARAGLDRPYGPAAKKLGIGPLRPKSHPPPG